MADTTEFKIDLEVGGAPKVESAAEALTKLASRLTDAGKATSAASDAVKASEAAYTQAEKAANRAALAVEKIGAKAEAQKGKLEAATKLGDEDKIAKATAAYDALMAKQAEAATRAQAASAAVSQQATALDGLKAAAKGAADAETQIQQAHEAAKVAADAATQAAKAKAKSEAEDAKKAADAVKKAEEEKSKAEADATKKSEAAAKKISDAHKKAADAQTKASEDAKKNFGRANELAEGFGKMGGPLGATGQKVFGLAEGFKKLGSALGAAGPYVAIAVAMVAIATAAVVATAAIIHFAIAQADAARSQGLLMAGIARSVVGGEKLQATIDSLATKVPLTDDELQSMAKTLADTGLRGQDLSNALETAAVKAAKLKFGPDFEKQLLALPNQAAQFKKNISNLFGGLNIEKFLESLSRLVQLFDTTDASGNAIKTLFEDLFQPLVDGIANFIPMMVTTFIKFEILVMKAAIQIKPWADKILFVGKALAVVAAVIIGVLLAALAMLVVGSLAFAAVLGTIIFVGYTVVSFFVDLARSAVDMGLAIINGPGGALSWFGEKFRETAAFLQNISLESIANAMMDGFVSGIMGGGARIYEALTGSVTKAIDGAKKLLGIASPSKVFAEIGMNTAAGMAEGVEGSTGEVQGALETMVAPPAAGSIAAPTATGDSGSSGGGNYAGAIFNFYGVEGAEDAIDRFLKVIEGDAAQLAMAVPNA